MTPRFRHWWLACFVLGELALAEWIRRPTPLAAGLAVGGMFLAAIGVFRRAWVPALSALFLVIQGSALFLSQRQILSIQRNWPRVREGLITNAAETWERELKFGRALVERVAGQAAKIRLTDQSETFRRLAQLISREDLEVGVVIIEADGTPYAWAGRYRRPPEAEGDSIDFRSSPYYAVIESRRHLANDRTVVASVLLAADATVPDRSKSLAQRFEARTGVELGILPPGVAPDTSDVYDYVEPTTSGPHLLFSVQLTPPSQMASYERAFGEGAMRGVVLGLIALIFAVGWAPSGLARMILLALPAAVAVRAPLGGAFGAAGLFSPRTFFHPLLGPISASAGPLALTALAGVVWTLAWLRRPHSARWIGWPISALLLLLAPYLVSRLGRGIQAPLEGVSFGLWLTWQPTIFLVAAAIVLPAAALLPNRAKASLWPVVLGSTIALGSAVVGLFVWNARSGWPDWYPALWAVALGFVIWPGRRAATIVGIGIAVGSAAALMVWGAEVESRITSARGDLGALGARVDPVATPLLEQFIAQAGFGASPRTASELFQLWRSSPLSRHGFPVSLGLWSSAGEPRAHLKLDEVDLPDSLVARLVRELPTDQGHSISPLQRMPAVHYLALTRLDPSTVLSVGLGPRSALVPQARLGRLLEPTAPHPPLYRLSLSPTFSLDKPHEGVTLWRREGWVARGGRTVAMGEGGGARDVSGVVDLGQPAQLLVRGSLLVVLDLALLLALAALAGWLSRQELRRSGWLPERRAFRTRIALALGAFFLVPAAGFALLNILELAQDGRSRRDLTIAQTLRDAAPGSTLPIGSGFELDRALEGLSERVDANLVLYRDGRLRASNGGGVFEDFGVVSPLIDPGVFHRIQLDREPTAVAQGPSDALPTRLGVRAVRLPTGDAAMLASPQPAGDPTITTQQLDLAYGLALAIVAGLIAALVGAQFSARALSRPASDLRDAALAFGRGEPLPPPSSQPPTEFTPVFAALERMAADVRATQEAQERAARVLAWGEMANQIAHEIKNPLTPMRLGVQHLLRVHRDGRPLGPALEDTSRRILGEIDRLDTIARAFSRFAAPADAGLLPLESVALGEVCREVVALYQLAPGSGPVSLAADREVSVLAHRNEVKEALINLLENARNAEARATVVRIEGPVLTVEDDGHGIPADQLPRIFEPRFSTTTSGSGLGLAIVKRLVEGWGATIEVDSVVERGTAVRIRFREPAEPVRPVA